MPRFVACGCPGNQGRQTGPLVCLPRKDDPTSWEQCFKLVRRKCDDAGTHIAQTGALHGQSRRVIIGDRNSLKRLKVFPRAVG